MSQHLSRLARVARTAGFPSAARPAAAPLRVPCGDFVCMTSDTFSITAGPMTWADPSTAPWKVTLQASG